MLKISKKVQFSREENKMNSVANTKKARELYYSAKSSNLKFLLEKRFSWMNKFIKDEHTGIEVGSGAGFTREFIKNKNLKLTDLGNDDHLDFKNIDAQSTGFQNESFNFVIASNMIHHIPYPIKFFKEMHRILKKDGRLIIQDANCSFIFQIITMIMRHEGYDFTKDVWSETIPVTDENDLWSGNIAVPHLIFDNIENFNEHLGSYFKIEYESFSECFIFINSGGVCSRTFFVPLNMFFLNAINKLDNILTKTFPKIFAMGRSLVLKKI